MDIARIKEELSICYLKTIAAINGIALEPQLHDEDSIDVILKKTVMVSSGTSFISLISVQLKATSSTSQYSIGDNEITYKLKVKNYNDLCGSATTPVILALLILPDDASEWVAWDEEELILKGKMFWLSLRGQEKSENTDTVTVRIPLANRLSIDSIEGLLQTAAEEGVL